MIPKRYDKFGTVKIFTVSRKQWYNNFENPSGLYKYTQTLTTDTIYRLGMVITIPKLKLRHMLKS